MKHSKQDIEKLRLFYMADPPEGMTKSMVKNMSDSDLLDMDYFLNEDLNEIFNIDDDEV